MVYTDRGDKVELAILKWNMGVVALFADIGAPDALRGLLRDLPEA